MKKTLLTTLLIGAAAFGCDDRKLSPTAQPTATQVRTTPSVRSGVGEHGAVKEWHSSDRFGVEVHGRFDAGGREREIVEVTDRKTGRHYIGITGVGITDLYEERVQKGKQSTTETREE